ncbi:MAG: EFR1 family ferrodoxin [Candidatus Odinarchaeota archaeon]
MNVLIIYFSQTKNTEKIAYKIQKGILKSGNQCNIVKIKDVDVEILKNFDMIGLGTPTFFYREPRNVEIFNKKLPKLVDKHCFLFCTHGSIIGNTFFRMAKALKNKSFIIIGTFDTYASSSIQFYPTPMHTEGHPDKIEFKQAYNFGKEICSVSERIREGEVNLIPEFKYISDTWWARESERLTLDVLRKISPEFKINIEKCTKCLICQESCPADAIDVEKKPPEIQKEGCIFCWGCEKVCPVGAIETNWDLMRNGAEKNLLRYIEVLKKAEEKGKFRPYVDYEKIY